MQTAALARGVTVSALAAHKRLPEDWLREPPRPRERGAGGGPGVWEFRPGVLAIPYYGFDGAAVLCKRLRHALSAKEGSRWPRGTQLEAYGLWRLGAGGELFLVEGESNCWTLWHHGYPALGLPGASTARQVLHADALEGVSRVWVHLDPGRSGEEFLRGVCAALAYCRYRGEALVMDSGAWKDPSDIHVADPVGFDAAWAGRMREAAPLSPEWWVAPQALRRLLGEALRDPSPWLRRLLLDALAEDVGRMVAELVRPGVRCG